MDGARNVDSAPRRSTGAPVPLLRTVDVVSLVLGIVIGAGIFAVPSLVAEHASSGTTLLLAWLAGGVLSLAGAMCYAELAAAHPHSGGDYHYLRLAFGERLAFLFAWARLTVIPTGSIALLAYVFGDYASQVVDLGPFSAALYAGLVIAGLTALNALGLKSGSRTQHLLTALQVGGVLLIVAAGLLLAPAAAAPIDRTEVLPEATNWGLVLIFVMLAYGGWNEAAYVSAEVVGSPRRLPRALLLSIAVITSLYLLMNVAYLQVLGLERMAGSRAVAADMMDDVTGAGGAQLISTMIAIAALASVNATILMGARTTYAFGRNAPLFSWLGHWQPRLGAPVNALIAQAAIALALVLLGALTRQGFATMVEYTAPVFWLFFLLTGIALFVLRWRMPDLPRPFRVPLYPVTPLVFCVTCAYLLYASLRHTGIGALVGVGVLLVGVAVLWLGRDSCIDPARAERG